jgi:hypothetical protein
MTCASAARHVYLYALWEVLGSMKEGEKCSAVIVAAVIRAVLSFALLVPFNLWIGIRYR